MTRQKSERYYPVPGAIDGGEWSIDEATGTSPQVSLNKRGPGGTMFVPLDESERSRYVRYHELGHVKYSPKQVKNKPEYVPDWVLGACEDARVTELLNRNAPPPMKTQGFTEIEALYNVKTAMESDNDLFLGALVMSKLSTKDIYLLNETVQEVYGPDSEEMKRFRKVNRMVGKVRDARITTASDTTLSNFTQTSIKAAEDLMLLLSDSSDDEDDGTQEEWDQEGFEEMFEEYLESLRRENDAHEFSDDKARWGEMRIFQHQMNQSLPAKLRAPRRRASDRGVYPRNIHRWCSDKAVFTRKVRAEGGTVLIDASGSMRWNHQDLVEVVNRIPAGTIALYSGPIADDSTAGELFNADGMPIGALRIIAREGKYVGENFNHEVLPDGRAIYGGNLIDGPALEWLGRQEGPRIWISDAQVVGYSKKNGHATSPTLARHCTELMRKYRISRLHNLTEVVEYMERRSNR